MGGLARPSMRELALILEAPAVGLDWSEALRKVPGATLDGRLEGVELQDGGYAVVILQRVRGLPAQAVADVRQRLDGHYKQLRFEEVPAQGEGVLVRTRLRVESFASPALRFALRFHDQMKDILIHLEGDRMCLRGTPVVPAQAEEILARIRGFLDKQGLAFTARVRLGTECKCCDPLRA